MDDFSNDNLFENLQKMADKNDVKTGKLMWPLRVAVSGKQTTPAGATQIMSVIGKTETLSRINAAVIRLEENV